jgi:hypothetical protein
VTKRPILTTSAGAPSELPLEILCDVIARRRGGRTPRSFLWGGAGFHATAFAATVFAVAAAMILPARAQQVPHLNVDPVCHGIARHAGSAGERGGPDLSFRGCVASELQVRKRLAKQWSGFSSAARANCIGDINAGRLPSYTALLTCLQVARAAASMRPSTGGTH